MYSQEQLDEMAAEVDIVEYIGQTETLQRKGNNYFCCCPFHKGDDTPSLCIYPDKNNWYCFGCGAGSSIYDWIMKYNNLSFKDAIEVVEELTGSKLQQFSESESIKLLKQLEKQKSNKESSVNIRKTLNFTNDYLNKYSDELPQEWLNEDMSAEALKTYNIRIDHDANRIVYPVMDANNNFIGVKGRTRIKTYKELGLSKYMNYNKIGTIDYFQGWQQAESAIKEKSCVIVFEGVKSCIKAYGWGICNTVAAETSKLSDGQVKVLIKSGVHEVVIGFDSDQKFKDIIKDPKIQLLKKFTKVSIITDDKKRLGEKMAPVDMGESIFRDLLEERISI